MTLARYGPLLDAVRGLQWPSRRRATGMLPGAHESRRRGASPELSEYRAYRQGDDPRQLDWKLLARTDRAFIRLAEERSIVGTIFLLDASASMDFPRGGGNKWEAACALCVGMAAIAHASGDPVGLLVPTASGQLSLAPRTRRGTVQALIRALEQVHPSGATPLAESLARIGQAQRVVVLSDFLGDEAALRRACQPLLAGRREVHGVHVVADAELAPSLGSGLVEDPESPAVRRPLTAESRAAYVATFAAWRHDVAHAWRQSGAAFSSVITSEEPVRAIRRLVTT
ncbi:MAG: DUF58 domain-containing protein [Gemmatimonadaceae bacterium]